MNKIWDPNNDQCKEIAEIMRKKYKIDNVDSEKVRTKFRTSNFGKWIASQKKKQEKGKFFFFCLFVWLLFRISVFLCIHINGIILITVENTPSSLLLRVNERRKPLKRKRVPSEEEYNEESDSDDSDKDIENDEHNLAIVSFCREVNTLKLLFEPNSPHSFWRTTEFRDIPENFKLMQATVLTSSKNYYILYRHDLASEIIPHFQVTPPVVVLEIHVHPFYPEEIKPTRAWSDPEISMPRFAQVSKFVAVPLPPDALVGSTSVARYDYDTQYGRFVEIVIPRFSSSTFSLSPPSRQLKQQDQAQTTVPLHQSNSSPNGT